MGGVRILKSDNEINKKTLTMISEKINEIMMNLDSEENRWRVRWIPVSMSRRDEAEQFIHASFMDLKFIIGIDFNGVYPWCNITSSVMKDVPGANGITAKRYREIADENLSLEAFEFKNLGRLCCFENEDTDDIVVLINKDIKNGSRAFLKPDTIWSYAREQKADVIILPSSIHELILMPKKGKKQHMPEQVINEMIVDANKNAVEPQDVLGDHAYLMDYKTGEIKALR